MDYYYSKATYLVIVFFVCFNCKFNHASNPNLSREEELEIERQLKLLNKPFIKTYKTKEGDIIDCVDINKQPALDHPLLNNHKVQTLPSEFVSKLFKQDSSQSNNGILTSNNNNNGEGCPIGFVSIRRTFKEDLIRLKSLSSNNKNQQPSMNPEDGDLSDDSFYDAVKFPYDQNVVSHSLIKAQYYHGAKARIAVHNVSLSDNGQSSSANIWVIGGPDDSLNVLMAGWQVNPTVNGDSLPQTFVYWTVDRGATTGCYNMLCQGFVLVNPNIYVGSSVLPASIYQGIQYDYQFNIVQAIGHWWVRVGDNQVGLGYWPNELFPDLLRGADQVAWGGSAQPTLYGDESPPLGSGHKPNGKPDEAIFVRNIQYIAPNYILSIPTLNNTINYVSNSSCYDLISNENCGFDPFKYCFTFGGPGGHGCKASTT